jgi:hypothetical protein
MAIYEEMQSLLQELVGLVKQDAACCSQLPMSEMTAAKLHERTATATQWIRNGGSTL